MEPHAWCLICKKTVDLTGDVSVEERECKPSSNPNLRKPKKAPTKRWMISGKCEECGRNVRGFISQVYARSLRDQATGGK